MEDLFQKETYIPASILNCTNKPLMKGGLIFRRVYTIKQMGRSELPSFLVTPTCRVLLFSKVIPEKVMTNYQVSAAPRFSVGATETPRISKLVRSSLEVNTA